MNSFNSADLDFILSVRYKDKAFTFGSKVPSGQDHPEFYYAYLDRAEGGSAKDSSEEWTAFRKLTFPDKMHPLGIRLGAFDIEGRDKNGDPNTSVIFSKNKSFSVVADNNYIYLFRLSQRGTILADRFIYDASARRLVNVNEIRYVRSGNPDVPASQLDSFGAYGPDGDPFVEPTTEISINTEAQNTNFRFSVIHVPAVNTHYDSVWHIITSVGTDINVFTLARTTSVLFDTRHLASYSINEITSEGYYKLGASLSLTVDDDIYTMAAEPYFEQEKILNNTGNLISVKRGGNVMVAIQQANTNSYGIIDLEVGGDGLLAGMAEYTTANQSMHGPYHMQMNGLPAYGTAVEFDGNQDSVKWTGSGANAFAGNSSQYQFPGSYRTEGMTIELWVKPRGWSTDDFEKEKCIWSVNTQLSQSDEQDSIYLAYDNYGRLFLKSLSGGEWVTHGFPNAPSITPDCWQHITVILDPDNSNPVSLITSQGGQVYLSDNTSPITINSSLSWFNFQLGNSLCGGPAGLQGLCSEFRVWTGSDSLLTSHLSGLQDEKVDQSDQYLSRLLICESFEEGRNLWENSEAQVQSYIISSDSGRLGMATIEGAQWVSSILPSRINMPVQYVDNRLLSARSCLLSSKDTHYPQLSYNPTLLDSGDGLVRLYYNRNDNKMGVSHFDTSLQRSQAVLYWDNSGTAGSDTTGRFDNGIVYQGRILPKLVFTSLLTGVKGNECTVAIQEDTTTYENDNQRYLLITFHYNNFPTLSGDITLTETFSKVPANVENLVKIINGLAVSAATAGDVNSADKVIYDYENNVRRVCKSGNAIAAFNLNVADPASGSILYHATELNRDKEEIAQVVPDTIGSVVTNYRPGVDSTWINEPASSYLGFSGTSIDYVNLTPDTRLAFKEEFCIEHWVQSLSDPGRAEFILYNNIYSENVQYATGLTADNKAFLTYRNSDIGSNEVFVTSARPLPVAKGSKTWLHLAANYRSGYALRLQDGTYGEIPDSKSLHSDHQYSVEAWVKPDEFVKEQIIASKWGATDNEKSWRLGLTPSGKPYFKFADSQLNKIIIKGSPLTTDWHHIAAAYSPSHTRTMLKIDETVADVDFEVPDTLEQWPDKLTLECWVSADDNDEVDDFCIISGYYVDKSKAAPLMVMYDQTHSLTIHLGSHQKTYSDIKVSPDKLFHLALSIDQYGSSSQVKVYVDGEKVFDHTYNEIVKQNYDFDKWVIGATLNPNNPDDHKKHFSGYLADVRIWKSIRTHDQIVDFLNVEVPGNNPDLICNFTMDQYFDEDLGDDNQSGHGDFQQDKYIIDSVSNKRYYANTADQDALSWVNVQTGKKLSLYVDGNKLSDSEVTITKGSEPVSEESLPFLPIQQTKNPLMLGTFYKGEGARDYAGLLDNVRIWNIYRLESQIDHYRYQNLETKYDDKDEPSAPVHLVAAYTFDKDADNKVLDATKKNEGLLKGRLSSPKRKEQKEDEKLYIPSTFNGEWELYLDGIKIDIAYLLPEDIAASGFEFKTFDEFLFGGAEGSRTSCSAKLAEIRLWSKKRTEEEIKAQKNVPISGSQDKLAGYWPFNDGSGKYIRDKSPYQNHGEFHNTPIVWEYPGSTDFPAPVNNDTLLSINSASLEVFREGHDLMATSSIGVAEYNSGLDRAYSFKRLNSCNLHMTQGEQSGSYKMVYIGQAQYDPKITGFIEGAPPVPSENLTVDQGSNPDKYVGTAKVSIVQHSETKQSAESTTSGAFNIGFEVTADPQAEADNKVSVGPVVATTQVSTAKTSLGVNLKIKNENSFGGENSDTREASTGINKYYELMIGGSWEPNIYNIPGVSADKLYVQAPRLYRPNNMAMAVVKSRTADVYAVQNEKTGATLGYQYVLDPDIPEDSNLIMFRLNPAYVSNGSLDGRIGFDNDVSYPDLAGKPEAKASFFKAKEAYQIQSKIEREQATLFSKAAQEGEAGGVFEDFSLVDTYAWTADGGFLSEDKQLATSFSETFGSENSTKLSNNISYENTIKAGFGVIVGIKTKLDIGWGGELKVKSSSTTGEGSTFGLDVSVGGEGFLSMQADMVNETPQTIAPQNYQDAVRALNNGYPLNDADLVNEFIAWGMIESANDRYLITRTATDAWNFASGKGEYIITSDPDTDTITSKKRISPHPGQYPILFQSENCPGKVTGYRFKSYYLHPSMDNFDLLAKGYNDGETPLIDQDWLNDERNPDAVAMKHALTNSKKVWRIFHRVTYVSRVPPNDTIAAQFDTEEVPHTENIFLDMAAQDFTKPDEISIDNNYVLVQTIMGSFGKGYTVIDPGNVVFTDVENNVIKWIEENKVSLDIDPQEADQLYSLMTNWFRAYLQSDD
ncbi:LamG-like jellyroll fold domain-containing protein [Roseivirga sp. BDSF3-8]|uniref:LamG-like jellyroll fold domain-containing protein n=1 Tax=Roseivirga sp. BDSF3-8 TaxID=3241598 RepID=UPI00353258B0